jgi:hypothetical protein
VPTRPRLRLAALATAALLAGCGSDSGVAPSSRQPVDLAQVFSEMSVPGLSSATTAAGGVSAPSASVVPTGCSYASASQSFVCLPVTTNGLTITQSYTLLTATGSPLSTFDASAVAAVRARTTVAGTVTSDGSTITFDSQQDQTISGLQTGTHTLNGTAVTNMSGTLKSGTKTEPFTSKGTMTTTGLVLPVKGSGSNYPSAGTVTVDQTSSFGGTPAISTHAVMTFNGTSKVKMTISIGGISLPSSCTIDLASSTPSCGP